ncbi:MAG: preprotein translocase subunit SecY, partial [Planctomycetes bacterium]|nr:preprotein translocase subunit SecY [Planctomycetota bacterium]
KQYSRYMTLVICIVQAWFVTNLLMSSGLEGTLRVSGTMFFFTTVLTMTAGTFFLMFLADKITEKGLGNGTSLIIQAGILASIPQTMLKLAQPMFDSNSSPATAIEYFVAFVLLILMFVAVTYAIVQVTLGRREIPIQHAKHTRGQGGAGMMRQQTIPLKVDQAGVIPIIFASALLVFPTLAFTQLGKATWLGGFLSTAFGDFGSAYGAYGWVYEMSYVGLIFFFTYFWTQLTFSPTELAKNMRDWGAYIPGVRPGADTVEYLKIVLKRMTLAGAIFLSLVAVIPNLFPHIAGMVFGDSQALSENKLFYRIIGGTGLLIVVAVALDLVQRIEAELITRSYDTEGGDAAAGGGRRRRN